MAFARALLSLLAALLVLPSIATGIAAQVEGESWISPTYGFSVTWAGTDWVLDPDGTLTAVGAERLDRIHLLNGLSSLYFEGATRYAGNLSSCVAEEANLLAEETGVSEIRPYRDRDGVQLIADGPNSSAAAFSLTLAVAGQEVDLVDYVECRTLVPDQAVLIITLVTEPATFDEELASARAVVDTITQSVAQPLDPLAAYGGWLAAAQTQPSIAGPLSGELSYGPGVLAVERAGIDASDVYVRAEFANPEPLTALWDVGIGFRDGGGEEQLRLVVDSEGNWFLKDGLGGVIAGGTVVDVDASPAGTNIIEIVAAGDTGYFAFNERLVSELDLSARAESGDVFAGAGFFNEDATAERSIAYREFEAWSLAGLDPQAVAESRVPVDAATFPQIVAFSSAASPLAEAASGELVQAVGSATIMPIGVVVEDFVARVEFTNPSDASDRPWDFGIAFREQESGDHYRITIASDGTWEYQIGLQTDLAGGSVPLMSFDAGAVNTLEFVAAGDQAGFAVNGVFVSALDASQIDGASDVWIGAGFHQADAVTGEVTRFANFAVWALDTGDIPAVAATPEVLATPVAGGTPVAAATPTAPAMATPLAGVPPQSEEIALRLDERDDSGIDALAVVQSVDEETTIDVVARGATGGEVVVVHDGTCADSLSLPAFLLEDLDSGGRSETLIAAPIADLTDAEHAIAIHRSAEMYEDVVACGDISGAG